MLACMHATLTCAMCMYASMYVNLRESMYTLESDKSHLTVEYPRISAWWRIEHQPEISGSLDGVFRRCSLLGSFQRCSLFLSNGTSGNMSFLNWCLRELVLKLANDKLHIRIVIWNAYHHDSPEMSWARSSVHQWPKYIKLRKNSRENTSNKTSIIRRQI